MTLLNAKAASKYISSSILIGVVLGAIGAVVANLFRNGIVFLSEWEVSLFQSLPRFLFYFIALTLSAIIVHFIKKQLNTAAFYNIGAMYANGEVFDRNYVIGYIWLYLASLHESDESELARNTIKKLENYMSEDEITDALDLSSTEGIEYALIEIASEALESN